jgi:ABC-type glycerol-3-phosphate transport system substrate-binding protein
MSNRRVAGFLTCGAVVLTLLLSGCGSTSTPSITFMYWSNLPSSETAYNTALARFHTTYPQLSVTNSPLPNGPTYYEKLLVLYAAQSAPDVIFITNPQLSEYATRGGLVNLTPRVDAAIKSGTLHLSKSDLSSCSTAGKVYGVPSAGTCFAITDQSKQVAADWTLIVDLIQAGFLNQ